MFEKNMHLKCSTRQNSIENRLQYNPKLIEFHLYDTDIFLKDELIKKIRELKAQGIKVYLHQPHKFRDIYLDIVSPDQDIKDFYRYSTKVLAEICQQEDIQCIIHAQYDVPLIPSRDEYRRKTEEIYNEIRRIEQLYPGIFLWEHVMYGLFTPLNPYLISDVVRPLNLSLCFDLSHIFIAHKGNNDKLLEELKNYKQWIHYFHVVDSMGEKHDGLPLGKGLIDWKKVIPYINTDFIFEIALPDVLDARPMVESVQYFNTVSKNFPFSSNRRND